MREEEKPNASALHGSGKQAIKAMSPRLFDTVGGAMGGEKEERGVRQYERAMTMGTRGEQARGETGRRNEKR